MTAGLLRDRLASAFAQAVSAAVAPWVADGGPSSAPNPLTRDERWDEDALRIAAESARAIVLLEALQPHPAAAEGARRSRP